MGKVDCQISCCTFSAQFPKGTVKALTKDLLRLITIKSTKTAFQPLRGAPSPLLPSPFLQDIKLVLSHQIPKRLNMTTTLFKLTRYGIKVSKLHQRS